MKLGIMQPYFFPYIGYFQAINAVDKYILYSNLTFIKDAWMNRNRLMLKNGEVQLITVPLLKKSSNTLISQVEIDNSKLWTKKMLKSIFLNYKGAEYFDEVYPLLENLLSRKYSTLLQLNSATIRGICEFLDMNTIIDDDNSRFEDMEELLEKVENDYSLFPFLKSHPARKVVRVLEMCRREDCHFFINAIGGQALYDKDEFASYGIDLRFIQTNSIVYDQFGNPFHPNLSIIDVLMHNGKERTKQLLNEYSLI